MPLCAAGAYAQSETQQTCSDLRALVNETDGRIIEPVGDVDEVLAAQSDQDCAAMIVMIEESDPNRQGQPQDTAQGDQPRQPQDSQDQSAQASDPETQTRDFQASDTVSDTVEITKQAIVEGEVVATMPNPEVDVQQPGAEVRVQPGSASVNVDQQAPRIVVRQAQPTIRVELPQPVITIDQPAPEIQVTMPDPDTRCNSAWSASAAWEPTSSVG
jgi:hypothetical protein